MNDTDEGFIKSDSYEERRAKVNDFIHEASYVPMKEKELAVFFQVASEDRDELTAILDDLMSCGMIERTKRGRYAPSDGGIVGIFTSNSKGFGFVTVEGKDEDIYIPQGETKGAFPGDTVSVVLVPSSGPRKEGRVGRILVRGITELVGTYEASKTYGFVRPDNKKIPSDIFVLKEKSRGAVDGDKVVVEITDYGDMDNGKSPEGRVKEIIGNINDPGVDIISIVKAYDIPFEFPERVMNQAERTADSVSEADMAGRRDLRDVQMVTIDGADSKDLDDAVNVTVDDKGLFHLGVHIADVANYVQENSALDREAKKRGTSVYLVDRVIPMLPHKLSNGICSLNQGEDRLALSCLMTINRNGDIIDHDIVESVINVDKRMTYDSVARIILDEDPEDCEKYAELVPMFKDMYELARILKAKRTKRGAVEFDSVESKIVLDSEGKPVSIKPEIRNAAHELIEDFMLSANETVAQHFYWLQMPFVYRTHEQPGPEKIDALASFVRGFGYHLNFKSDEIRPMEIQKLLSKVSGSAEQAIISRVALRSMMQAKYTTECSGHFGLALQYYCHFTSPIRRYPDLQIHRIIKDFLRGRMDDKKMAHYAEILPEVANHSSETERRADEAERETDKLKKAQYMEEHIGEEYEGTISGVTGFGIFVELENTCEGLIRLSDMTDDYYEFDPDNYTLTGTDFGKVYSLGEKVRIRVRAADRVEKTIDFEMLD
ncbi:ribonuclease R [Butyrivibrio sp. MC2013]|uniref:ribonuclease R n=1 Tax=Butyrivibrio sp. MC2013 TaxID=1280686 RepID=UPI000408C124|nr:ribonuclease R [Butyrivibrio sp. MC2013]